MSRCCPKDVKLNVWGSKGDQRLPSVKGDLWPLEQKLNQHYFCYVHRHISRGIQAHVPPRWPRWSHRPGHTGQSGDWCSWVKGKGKGSVPAQHRRLVCAVSHPSGSARTTQAALSPSKSNSSPHRAPSGFQGARLPVCAWLGTFRRVQPKHL